MKFISLLRFVFYQMTNSSKIPQSNKLGQRLLQPKINDINIELYAASLFLINNTETVGLFINFSL